MVLLSACYYNIKLNISYRNTLCIISLTSYNVCPHVLKIWDDFVLSFKIIQCHMGSHWIWGDFLAVEDRWSVMGAKQGELTCASLSYDSESSVKLRAPRPFHVKLVMLEPPSCLFHINVPFPLLVHKI